MRRLDSLGPLASLDHDGARRLAPEACRPAFAATSITDQIVLNVPHSIGQGEVDGVVARELNALAGQLDEQAWQAQERGDDVRYEALIRRSRAVSSVAFALSGEAEEAIYEAAHAVDSPEVLARRIGL